MACIGYLSSNNSIQDMKTLYLFCLCLFVHFHTFLQAQMIDENIKKHIRERIENHYNVGISVAYLKGNQVAYFQAGTLGVQSQKPINEHTVFEIGSITKTFTTLLLADAVAKGLVKLDDPIQDYLPKNQKMPSSKDRAITFRDLATHTSGLPRLPDNLDVENDNPYSAYDSPKMFEFLGNYQLTRAVGDLYEYSNLGMGLLGVVMGKIHQKTYAQTLYDLIFTPLQMNDSQIETQFPKDFENIAYPHNGRKSVKMWGFDAMAGAGAIKSSTADLVRYVQAHLGIFRTDLFKAMQMTHQSQKALENGKSVGLGWHIYQKNNQSIIWHNGGTMGSCSFLAFNPQTQTGVIVLSNSNISVDDIGMSLILNETNLLKIRKKITLSEAKLKEMEGVYELGGGFQITVRLQKNQLTAQATGQDTFEIYPETENLFFYTVVEAQLEFERDETGQVKNLVLHQNGRKIKGMKIN